jgi:Ser/Thr protein kinase RdoA (MazF antagonist)
MKSNDDKIYKSVIQKVVRTMEKGKKIYPDEFSEICAKYNFKVTNPESMLARISRNTNYLYPFGDGRYIRTINK